MVEGLRSLLRSLFNLLPLKVQEQDLESVAPEVRDTLPVNFAAIAANGFSFPTAGKVVAAGLLLTWFVSELTPSAFWVGLIVPIQYGLSTLVEPIAANWLSARKQRVLYYTGQALTRAGLWVALAAAALVLSDEQSTLLLIIFFVIITADAAAAGLGTIVFNDTIARVIPQQLRGRVRGWRGVFGGIVAGATGIFIQTSLTEASGIRAYAILFILAGVLYGIGGLVFGAVQEPQAESSNRSQPGIRETIRRIRELLKDKRFRRFVLVQILLIPLVQGLPFFTLYAKQGFGLEINTLGILVIVSAITPIIASYVFGRLADSIGNRKTIMVSTVVGLLAPVGVLFLAGIDEQSGGVIALVAFIVFSVNAASQGFDLSTKNYMLDLASSDEERPFFIAVNDVLIGLPTMVLVAAGLIIDLLGFAPVFIGIGLFAAAAIVITIQLPDQRNSDRNEDRV